MDDIYDGMSTQEMMNEMYRNEPIVAARKEVTDLVAISAKDIEGSATLWGNRINVSFQEDGLFLGSLAYCCYSISSNETFLISTYEKQPFSQWRDKVDRISEIVTPPWFFGVITAGSLVWFSSMVYLAESGYVFPLVSWLLSIILTIGGFLTALLTGSEWLDWWWIRSSFNAPEGSRHITKTAGKRLANALSSLTPENRHEYAQLIKTTMKDYDSDAKLSVWLEQLAKILEISPDYPATVVPLTLGNITEAKNKLVERAEKARALELENKILELEEKTEAKRLEGSLREEFDAPLKDSALDFIDTIPLETLK